MKARLFVDKSVCTGCRYCEAVCSLVHSYDQKVNFRLARIKVDQDFLDATFTPVVCKQCKKAPCVEACPFEAIVADSLLGIPTVDSEKCTACLVCLEACPFGAMYFDSEREVAIKCDLCGGDPKCVKFCRASPHVGYAAITYSSPDGWSKRKLKLV